MYTHSYIQTFTCTHIYSHTGSFIYTHIITHIHTHSHTYIHIKHILAFIDISHTFPCTHSYTYTYTHIHSPIPFCVFSILLCSYHKLSITLGGENMISAYSSCQRPPFLSLQRWVLLDVRHAMSNTCKMSLVRKFQHYKHMGGLNTTCGNPAKTDLRSAEWKVRNCQGQKEHKGQQWIARNVRRRFLTEECICSREQCGMNLGESQQVWVTLHIVMHPYMWGKRGSSLSKDRSACYQEWQMRKGPQGPSPTGLTRPDFVAIILYEIQIILSFFFNWESFIVNFWSFTTGVSCLIFYSLFIMETALSVESSGKQGVTETGASRTCPGFFSFTAVLMPY